MNPATLSALAEPTRLQMVELLNKGPLTVGEIALGLQLRQPQASKHLRILSEAGLVEVEAVANRRIYRLRAPAFQELDAWLSAYRQLWVERFDQLEEHLQRLQQTTGENAPPPSAPPSD